MKKKMLAISASIMCVLCVTAGSLAFSSKEGIAKNVIASSNLQAELVVMKQEHDGSLVPAADENEILPGANLSRIIQVENTGDEPAWIRIRLENDDKLILTGVNDKDWSFREGFWYYGKELKKGETTESLCTGVELDSSTGNDYALKSVNFKVYAQATQVKHNGSTALEAKGWPQD